jgi:DNA-binding NarL/FixJ family response regulator
MRVLMVDDYAPWRRFVSSMLQKQPELQVIGEVSDGLEAVRKAEELQPDLILLDIGLPKLNGIEAARRIRKLSPIPKILFASENRSPAIAREALRTGAGGYVVKSDAATQLLPAVNAVLEGKRFVSASLSLVREQGHVVQFYTDDADLLDSLGALFSDELRAGNSVAAVIRRSHREGLLERLVSQGIDVDELTKEGRLAVLDAVEALDRFMDADGPNRERFLLEFGKAIRAAAGRALKKNVPLVLFGEMVAVLWERKKYDAAVRLEQLWNELALTHSFYLCCAYPAGEVQGESKREPYAAICTEHTEVVYAF